MKQKDPILYNESDTANWNIVLNSIHVMAYRLWKQDLNSDTWEMISDGTSSDNIADHGSFKASRGTKFAYWLGVGSTVPGSNYDVSIVLSQESRLLVNGLMNESGSVDDNGEAWIMEVVTLL